MADSPSAVQTTSPWGVQQPYLEDIFGQARDLYYNWQPAYYPGNTIAPYSPQERWGQGQLTNYGMNELPLMLQQWQGAHNFALDQALNPQMNPYLAQSAQAAISPVREELMQSILPSVRGGAMQAGQYGSSKQNLATAMAIDKATENMLNTTSQMYGNAYQQGLDLYGKALGMVPAMAQLGTMPAQLVSSAGAMDRNMEQAIMDDYQARWNFSQQAPWTALSQYQNAVQGGYGGQSTSLYDQGGSDFSRSLGDALSGYTGGSWLGQQLGWDPTTTGIVTALMSIFL